MHKDSQEQAIYSRVSVYLQMDFLKYPEVKWLKFSFVHPDAYEEQQLGFWSHIIINISIPQLSYMLRV